MSYGEIPCRWGRSLHQRVCCTGHRAGQSMPAYCSCTDLCSQSRRRDSRPTIHFTISFLLGLWVPGSFVGVLVNRCNVAFRTDSLFRGLLAGVSVADEMREGGWVWGRRRRQHPGMTTHVQPICGVTVGARTATCQGALAHSRILGRSVVENPERQERKSPAAVEAGPG